MAEDKVTAIFMLEILGKPAEHVKETLNKIVESLGNEKNVSLVNKKIAEPKEVEGEKGVFTSFAEIEFETDIRQLMLMVFGYMPSHVEIIEPEFLKIQNSDLNIFLNELSKKLHKYDEIAKAFMLERQMIAKKIQNGEIVVKKPEEVDKENNGKE